MTNSLLNDSYVVAAEQIQLYGIVTLLPMGIILNTLSFVVFYKIKKHKSAVGLRKMCMAIADSCALLAIQDLHIVLCKTSIPLGNAGSLWSGVLLASATVERYCCIAYPLKVKTWNLTKLVRS